MKIEAGKYYRTRGGDVVGPMARYAGRDDTFTAIGHTWYEDGSFVRGNPCKMDLISEVYVSDTPPADTPAPETIRLDPRTEWKLFRQMGPHELVTNASVPMLETKTLRDEFAMAAMQGAMVGYHEKPAVTCNNIATWAYDLADAMMEARKK